MFGKKNLVEHLSHDLDRARARRDALASDVTTLAARIAELEARLSAEKNRRERARVEGEIASAKERLEDAATKFVPAIARLCDATAAAATVVPDARELNALLVMVAAEVAPEIEKLLCELRQRAETVRASRAASPPADPPAPKKISDRVPLLLPAFLPRTRGAPHVETADERQSTAA